MGLVEPDLCGGIGVMPSHGQPDRRAKTGANTVPPYWQVRREYGKMATFKSWYVRFPIQGQATYDRRTRKVRQAA